ncbi:MAG: MarR family transcriptional regulator [Acidimicrobiales bacterium]
MPAGFSSSDADELLLAERQVQAKLGELEGGDAIDLDALAAVSNIFRVASTARYHFERKVLVDHDLSFTAFTVLWVLWIWGEQESRHLAAESGISKGTLTGVIRTLEKGSLVERRTHPADGRLALLKITNDGERTMEKLFPVFNQTEAAITSGLQSEEKRELANLLRRVLTILEGDA